MLAYRASVLLQVKESLDRDERREPLFLRRPGDHAGSAGPDRYNEGRGARNSLPSGKKLNRIRNNC